MTEDPFDLANLALPPGEMIRERRVSRLSRRIRHGHFIKVPCIWIERLTEADSSGATFRVALHLLYQHWKTHGQPVSLSNVVSKREGLAPRTKWRALQELEGLGLVTIERRPRKAPLVTVHEHPQA